MSDEYSIGNNFLASKIDDAEYKRKMDRLGSASEADGKGGREEMQRLAKPSTGDGRAGSSPAPSVRRFHA